MFALDIVGYLRLFIGKTDEFDSLLNSYEILLIKTPSSLHAADFDFIKGYFDVRKGSIEIGIEQMSKGVAAFQACGTRSQLSLRKTIIAQTMLQINHSHCLANNLTLEVYVASKLMLL
jgi:hypothetical protein